MPNPASKLAVITGASSGIGAVFARRLASDGYDLILASRRADVLESLARDLRSSSSVSVEVVPADLSLPSEMQRLAALLASRPVDLLVNNAGFGAHELYHLSDPKTQSDMLLLHTLCPMLLTRAVLPGMISRRAGAVVNVSSETAFLSMPFYATYCATKAFLNSFSRSLHIELMGTGVKIQALCPGITRTDFHRRMGIQPESQINGRFVLWLTPESVVDCSLKCLRKDRVICVPGLSNRLQLLLIRLIPDRLYYRLARRILLGKS